MLKSIPLRLTAPKPSGAQIQTALMRRLAAGLWCGSTGGGGSRRKEGKLTCMFHSD